MYVDSWRYFYFGPVKFCWFWSRFGFIVTCSEPIWKNESAPYIYSQIHIEGEMSFNMWGFLLPTGTIWMLSQIKRSNQQRYVLLSHAFKNPIRYIYVCVNVTREHDSYSWRMADGWLFRMFPLRQQGHLPLGLRNLPINKLVPHFINARFFWPLTSVEYRIFWISRKVSSSLPAPSRTSSCCCTKISMSRSWKRNIVSGCLEWWQREETVARNEEPTQLSCMRSILASHSDSSTSRSRKRVSRRRSP